MIFNRSIFIGKSSENPIDEIKNSLIDKFLFFGVILGSIVFVISFFPISKLKFNFDFFTDIFNISALFGVYFFRDKISTYFKATLILVFLYSLIITDLFENGVGSTDQVLIVFIPFLSVLVFSIRSTMVIFFFVVISYAIIAYGFLNGILTSPTLNPEWNTIASWVNTMTTISMVSLLLSIFVYAYNTSSDRLISDLELRNEELNIRDSLLENSLQEKNVMIQEIHHRVKNNLAVVSGLLELQSYHSDNHDFRYILSKSTNRIMSIAKVHEMLYESDDFSNIPFTGYVEELSKIVASSMNKDDKDINFDFDIKVDTLNINHGVPLGIILNELITNSIKYGFKNSEDCLISISVSNSDDIIKVIYEDNGIGIPNFEVAAQKSLGLTLIHSLMDQIEANYEYDTNDKFKLSFAFPLNQNNGPYQSESSLSV